MAKKSMRVFASLLIVLFVFFSFGLGTSSPTAADSISCFAPCGTLRVTAVGHPMRTRTVATETDLSKILLYPGGMPFGVKFITEGVLVVGFCEAQGKDASTNPAIAAGLRQGDTIPRVGGNLLSSASELNELVENGNGAAVSIRYARDGKEYETTLKPVYSAVEGRYKSGIYVRDSGAGIGTVTYIIPNTLAFGGLGHGICDAETGELIPIQRGSVVGVTINGVVKGLAGDPGEVKGFFSSGKTGSLIENTECGVFGVFGTLPKGCHSDPMPIGSRHELHDGKAHVYCTLDSNTVERYEIEICDIHRDSTSNKCFTVKVTDPRLLEKTGGIIQGMSGSPIIQNGKLVGAVTHVLINDPTTGYGIFIENMLNAAQMPMAKAA
jgi:stage IV sporulation protein B